MATTARIAIMGFSPMERATFEAFFRIAGKRKPAYAHEARLAAADFVIVDAADAAAVAQVREGAWLPRAVALGEPACPGAMLQLPRPLNLMLVVRALDEVIARRGTVAEFNDSVPADLPSESESRRALAAHAIAVAAVPTEPMSLEPAAAQPAASPAEQTPGSPAEQTPGSPAEQTPVSPAARAPSSRAARRDRKPRSHATTVRDGLDTTLLEDIGHAPAEAGRRAKRRAALDHILVVDDSDIALRFMAGHLQRFGFQIHLAQSGEEALRRVAERHFEFVFMDVMMEGLDGFQTCKAIKRATYPAGKQPPTVVMLTARGTAVDKLRGTMAGADAYLTKPLREVELLKVVGDREVERYAYASTAAAMTTL
jgi:CheY-like chemotaxis protein